MEVQILSFGITYEYQKGWGGFFMIWSFKYHSSVYINVLKVTTILHRIYINKLNKFFQVDFMWCVLHNRDCGDALTDVKSEGANTETV